MMIKYHDFNFYCILICHFVLQNKFSRHKVYDNFPYYENGKNYILPVLSTLMFISIVKFYVLPEQLFKNVFLLAHFEVGIYAFFFFVLSSSS